MSFLNPFLLLGLLAVAIPLLIHLVNLRRPTKVRFSTLLFFDSIRSSTLNKIRIKKWLLLAIRIAAVLMLAFALARPFIPSGAGDVSEAGQPASIGILIDNSPSMSQVDQNGPFIDQAKGIASGILEHSRNDDRIYLEVTNGPSLDLPALTPDAAASRIAGLDPVNQGNFISENMRGLVNRLDQASQPHKRIYLITDGQVSQLDPFDEGEPTFSDSYPLQVFVAGDENQANVAITEMDLESEVLSRNQPVRLTVAVGNFSSSPVRNHFLSLHYQDEIAGEHQVNLEAGASAGFSFEIVPDEEDILTGSFLLEGDELTFDNRHYFSIRIPERRRILLVQDESASDATYSSYLSAVLEAALSANEFLDVENVSWSSDLFAGDAHPDAVILDGVDHIPEYVLEDLVQFTQNGGGILFLPSANGDIRSYNRFLERTNTGQFTNVTGNYGSFEVIDRLSGFRQGHPVLEEMFDLAEDEDLRVNLPAIFYQYILEIRNESGIYRILNSGGDNPVLTEHSFGDGILMVSSIGADPGWSDFPVKPLFAPLFYRTVLYLATSEQGGLLGHTLGERFRFQMDGSPEDIVIEAGGQQIIPERRSAFQGLMISEDARDWEPGFAEIGANGEKIAVAVNQHTMESDFVALQDHQIADHLENYFGSVSVEQFQERETDVLEQLIAGYGREIWYWFIAGAIFLLLTESVVARLFKAESIQ